MINYLIIFIILMISEIIYFKIADKFNIIDKPNLRSSHTKITLRGGGIIFSIGTIIYLIVSGFQNPYFIFGMILISTISFYDDIKSISPKVRLIIQFISIILMFIDLNIININNWWIIILAIILCVGIINAYNFMDGINGITGGYSLIVLSSILYVNQNFVDNNLLIIAIFADIVFCIFNFRNKAKCFAGDVGSVGIAFIILFCLGNIIIKTQNFTYIIFLIVYGIDSVLTICHRILLHENLSEAHRKHVYQIMANELKMPHIVVSLIYMILQLVISFGLILLPINNWIYLIVIIICLTIAYILFKKKYYHLHEEYIKQNANK